MSWNEYRVVKELSAPSSAAAQVRTSVCVAVPEGVNSSSTTPFSSCCNEKVFRGFSLLWHNCIWHIHFKTFGSDNIFWGFSEISVQLHRAQALQHRPPWLGPNWPFSLLKIGISPIDIVVCLSFVVCLSSRIFSWMTKRLRVYCGLLGVAVETVECVQWLGC